MPIARWTMAVRSVRYSTLPALASADGLADVEGDRAGLGVRHQAAGTERPAQLADYLHHVRSGDADIEIEPAALDLLGQILAADHIGAGVAGFLVLVALGEDTDAHLLAGAVRQHGRAADHLVGLARIDAQTEMHLDGLVELGRRQTLEQLHRFQRRIKFLALDLPRGLHSFFCSS